MYTLALEITHHSTLRLLEVAGAATAVAGVLFFLGSGVPFGRRGGQALGGLLLVLAGVLWVVAIRWGRLTG
jgi:drug/metabolite transporter (DMT)-like permease